MRRTLVVALIALAGCQTGGGSSNKEAPSNASMYTGGDGLSMKTAIVVNAESDAVGTHAVYAWLRQNCKCQVKGQSLVTDSGHAYDVMEVARSDGSTASYYFDITKYFGKY